MGGGGMGLAWGLGGGDRGGGLFPEGADGDMGALPDAPHRDADGALAATVARTAWFIGARVAARCVHGGGVHGGSRGRPMVDARSNELV